MKKLFLFTLVIVALVFISNKTYQHYSRNYVNSHESIVLINNLLHGKEVDSFFSLDEGTYNSEKHKVVFSLVKKEGYLLNYYINLPAKKTSNLNPGEFDCDDEYNTMRHYRFYDYEVGNRNVIARVINGEANNRKQLKPVQTVAKKHLSVNYKFGSINVFDVKANGISNHCN
jgi:hypothetical protein